MKRTIIFLLALTIGIALQAQTFTVDGITYARINDSTCEVRGTSLVNCIIPPFVVQNGVSYKVTSLYGYYHSYGPITQGAFRNNTTLQSLTIPYTINSISEYTFYGCSSLTTVIYNAEEVDFTASNAVFYNCSNITTVIIGDSVKTIPNYFMYEATNLTNLQISDNVKQIGNYAFCGCIGLSETTLPNNLQVIGGCAFYGCTGLFDISIPDSVRTISARAFEGCSNLHSLSIGRNVESFGYWAFRNCTSLHNVTYNARNASNLSNNYLFDLSNNISNLIIGSEVQSIPPYFMSSKPNIHNVVFPEGLTHIGNNAFYDCGLEELVIPSTVTNIGQNAFYNNTNISRIVSLPTTPPAIYQSTFSGVPNNVEKVVPCDASAEYNIRPWWNGMANVKETCRYSTIHDTICDGEIYQYGSHSVATSGTYHDTLHIDQYVDSMITVHLVVNPSYDYSLTEQICNGDSYTANGFNENESGTFVLSLQSMHGCDSIVRLNLTVNPTYDTTLTAAICQGDTYSQYGFNSSVAGNYSQNLSTLAGCDSIVNLQLSVNPSYSEHLSATITNVQSYQFVDSVLTQSGIYQNNLHTFAGCDSLLTLALTVIPSVDTLIVHDTILYPDTIIVVDTLFLHDTTIVHDTTTVIDTLLLYDTITVYDTTIVVDTMIVYADTLVIHDTIIVTDTIIPCPVYRTYIHATIGMNETYSDYGFNVSAAGEYCDTLQTTEGCDSIVCLYLTQNVGIEGVETSQIFSIYPNPASSSFTMVVPEGTPSMPINIIDNSGKVIMQKMVTTNRETIDVSTLPTGVYYVRFGETTNKLIIR